MTDDKQEPPKAAEGARTPVEKPAPESGGAGPQAKPVAVAPPKLPAAEATKPPVAVAKPPIKPEPWSSPLLDELLGRFPGAITEAVIFRKMPSLNLAKEHLVAICEFLKSPAGGAYTLLTDQTAVDYPQRAKRFDIIYHLYSFRRNDRLRLRVQVGEGETVPSVTSVWLTANWLEREVYDMFGVAYEGHPDLKRILMPDGWVGHPLRKDYDILKQDEAWVKTNLGIESAQ
jgi:NADH-quinone oxidoreductase subunit C